MTSCLACLGPVSSGDYHVTCLRRLFGSDAAPSIDLSESTMRTVALATLGRSSLPGVQPKISLGLVRDQRMTLRVNVEGRRQYILKPQTRNTGLDAMPENEQLSMLIARLFGILVPAFGLIRLTDGSLAYIVERFDRTRDGGKIRQEDFAQLMGVLPAHKYNATAEDCAAVIEQHSSRAGADLVRLFERYVLAFWIGDGDMHLKNLSLLAGPDGRHSLSPAYDIVSGAVYKADFPRASELAMPLAPGTPPLRSAWLRFAVRCGVPDAAAAAILRRPTDRLQAAERLLEQSLLPTRAMRSDYLMALRARADALLIDR